MRKSVHLICGIFLPHTESLIQYHAAPKHKAHISHELISGAAAYEAAKAYEDHVAKNGKPDSHTQAKEILAAHAGAFVDREVETRGLDFIDKKKAEREAKKHFEKSEVTDFEYN